MGILRPSNPSEEIVPYTNNFYLKLSGSWYRKEFETEASLKDMFKGVDKHARRLGIDQKAIVDEMMLALSLFNEGKYDEWRVHNDNAQTAIYPLFEAMVDAGFDPQDLVR